MALQVEIELGRVNDLGVNDSASRAISTSIRDIWGWEETDMVAFSDNDYGDLRVYADLFAGG
jgi:hypothetical protein